VTSVDFKALLQESFTKPSQIGVEAGFVRGSAFSLGARSDDKQRVTVRPAVAARKVRAGKGLRPSDPPTLTPRSAEGCTGSAQGRREFSWP
jgi:hypothetical protein